MSRLFLRWSSEVLWVPGMRARVSVSRGLFAAQWGTAYRSTYGTV